MQSKVKICTLLSLFLSVSILSNAQGKATPATERQKLAQQRAVLEKGSLLNSIAFRSIGPTVMSGRVVDIDANPTDPTEFYVGYASGGVWYTHNNGQSFTPVFDSTETQVIGDIAVNWKTGTIWVGTGEVNSSRSSYAGMGVYKSTDKGKTWTWAGLPDSHHIGKIQLHPTDNNVAWVAVLGHLYSPNTERGVYKTTDGGQTWKKTLYVDDNTGAVDLDINPQNPNEVYAAMWYRTRRAWDFVAAGSTTGIYKSTDGGNTWASVTKTGSGFPQNNLLGRIGIAVAPSQPQTVYAIVDNQKDRPDTARKDTLVYALADLKNLTKEQFARLDERKIDTLLKRYRLLGKYSAKQLKEQIGTGQLKATALYDYLYINTGFEGTPVGMEVYRSDNGGQTWKKTHEKELPNNVSYGYYFSKVYVSPTNADKIFTLGIAAAVSSDGGKTWKNMDKSNVHSDHHALWIDPARDSHLINGNDGGVNITYDNGEHWFIANSPAVGQFYSVVADNAKPYNVYGGLQDNGVWYGPSTNRESPGWQSSGDYSFKHIMGGDGMQVQVDTRDNATTYTGSQFGNYARLNRMQPRGSARRITPLHSMGEKPYRFNWQTPVLLSPHNQDIVYFGGNKFFRSMNKADTMFAMADLTRGDRGGNVPYGTITTISESPLRFGLLYAGTDDGNIQVSKDGGYSWTLVNNKTSKVADAPLSAGLWISRLVASRYKEPRVYATLNGYRFDDFAPYLYVSEDFGSTWTQLGKDLPLESINVVREDPKNENILYVGTDGGLYVSFNRGQTFMLWNGGLPKAVPVHDIAIQERENEIVLGTHGRSLYIAKLDDVQGLQKDRDWLKKKAEKEKGKPKPKVEDDDVDLAGEVD
ncbi:WD40/YVTN/BNR-like repeat-containing protein [Flavisolibacter nicotianae]|uniref:WD40/YVTN/BNR-like repeat-containing protein n=1 Tax=Flavisolibacter nicotianae TaxID=2364882 RepID=UPI000EB5BFE3|nr:glycosyl hydrolase [Flavisolibacter nicotianae]